MDAETLLPDWDHATDFLNRVSEMVSDGRILAASVVREGGAAANVCRMAFGDKLGFRFADGLTAETLFAPECASIVAELADGVSLDGFQFTELGVTADDGQFAIDGETLPVDTLIDAWTGTLEPVFPTKAEEPSMQAEIPLYTERSGRAPRSKWQNRAW